MIKILQNSTGKSFIQKWQFLTLILLIQINTSCTNNSAENTLSEYLNYTYLDNNGKKAYQLISSDDKKYISQSEFVYETKRKNIFHQNFLKNYKKQFSYEILETKHSNTDTIVLKAILRKPNTNRILNEMVTQAIINSSAKISGRKKHRFIDEKLGKMMTKNGLKMEAETKEFILVKENRRYKIHLNLKPSIQPKMVNNNDQNY